MTWTPEKKEKALECIFDHVCKGNPVRSLLDGADRSILPSNKTFLVWVEEDESIGKQYARARQIRAEAIFEEILKISDAQENDIIETENGPVVNHNVIARNRLQVDARKWMLGKMDSSKYGDKVDHTTNGKDMPSATTKVVFKKFDGDRT